MSIYALVVNMDFLCVWKARKFDRCKMYFITYCKSSGMQLQSSTGTQLVLKITSLRFKKSDTWASASHKSAAFTSPFILIERFCSCFLLTWRVLWKKRNMLFAECPEEIRKMIHLISGGLSDYVAASY